MATKTLREINRESIGWMLIIGFLAIILTCTLPLLPFMFG